MFYVVIIVFLFLHVSFQRQPTPFGKLRAAAFFIMPIHYRDSRLVSPFVQRIIDRFNRRVHPQWAGLIALVLVIGTLNQPGITIDEPLDVAPGRHYWDVLLKRGPDFFSPIGVKDAFGGNPDHPPLARWLLGAASHVFQTIQILWQGHGDPTQEYIVAARMASALAFALTVSMIAGWSAKRFGNQCGWLSGLSLILMPRVFGHAHLAALETILSLFFTAAALTWSDLLSSETVPRRRSWLKASVLLGLALLTKIQAWLLGPWLLMLLIFQARSMKARFSAVLAGCFSIVVWFAGWPWLWYESRARIAEYFFRSVDRVSLNVTYFGTRYPDNELPWHFIWVHFLTALPIVLFVCFCAGLIFLVNSQKFSGINQLKSFAVLIFCILGISSLPVARYDGDRLILMIYPLVAILTGYGAVRIYEISGQRTLWRVTLPILFFISVINILKPFPISYYNICTGGLRGAISLGLEPTWWADSVDANLLNKLEQELRPGESAALVPTLHGGQAIFSTPYDMLQSGRTLEDQSAWKNAGLIVVYRRTAYWPEGLADWIRETDPIVTRRRDGVWLSGLWPGPARGNQNGQNRQKINDFPLPP